MVSKDRDRGCTRNVESIIMGQHGHNYTLRFMSFMFLHGFIFLFYFSETSNENDCCYFHTVHPKKECETGSYKLTFSDCESLIENDTLRYFIQILIILIFGGNIFSLMTRLLLADTKTVQNLLICNLCISDMLMGIYLAGIMYKEMTTRTEYYKHKWDWQRGTTCKSLGAISVISSEVSVFTLVFIAYDRFLHVVHGINGKKLKYHTAVWLLGITWLISIVLAVLPALKDIPYFNNQPIRNFYGTNDICMPLQLGEHPVAWEYCLAIFGVINLIAALCLIFLYIRMFYSCYKTSQESTNVVNYHRQMAKRFTAIVATGMNKISCKRYEA